MRGSASGKMKAGSGRGEAAKPEETPINARTNLVQVSHLHATFEAQVSHVYATLRGQVFATITSSVLKAEMVYHSMAQEVFAPR
jgi:hypothetical protein